MVRHWLRPRPTNAVGTNPTQRVPAPATRRQQRQEADDPPEQPEGSDAIIAKSAGPALPHAAGARGGTPSAQKRSTRRNGACYPHRTGRSRSEVSKLFLMRGNNGTDSPPSAAEMLSKQCVHGKEGEVGPASLSLPQLEPTGQAGAFGRAGASAAIHHMRIVLRRSSETRVVSHQRESGRCTAIIRRQCTRVSPRKSLKHWHKEMHINAPTSPHLTSPRVSVQAQGRPREMAEAEKGQPRAALSNVGRVSEAPETSNPVNMHGMPVAER